MDRNVKTSSQAKPEHKILIVEDDSENHGAIEDILSLQYLTIVAPDGDEGLRIAHAQLPDLILLDIKMPRMGGIATCIALRRNQITRHIPVIIVTAVDEPEQRVEVYRAGADDYLVKPFMARELMARLSSKLRRIEERAASESFLSCGNIQIDILRMETKVNNLPVHISLLELELLKCFVRNKDRVLTRERILNEVWNDAVVSIRTVDTHIVSLRKKIAGGDHHVTTVYGAGYILKEKNT